MEARAACSRVLAAHDEDSAIVFLRSISPVDLQRALQGLLKAQSPDLAASAEVLLCLHLLRCSGVPPGGEEGGASPPSLALERLHLQLCGLVIAKGAGSAAALHLLCLFFTSLNLCRGAARGRREGVPLLAQCSAALASVQQLVVAQGGEGGGGTVAAGQAQGGTQQPTDLAAVAALAAPGAFPLPSEHSSGESGRLVLASGGLLVRSLLARLSAASRAAPAPDAHALPAARDALPALLSRLAAWASASHAAGCAPPHPTPASTALLASVRDVCSAVQTSLWKGAATLEEGGGGGAAELCLMARTAAVEWVCATAPCTAGGDSADPFAPALEKALVFARGGTARYLASLGARRGGEGEGEGGAAAAAAASLPRSDAPPPQAMAIVSTVYLPQQLAPLLLAFKRSLKALRAAFGKPSCPAFSTALPAALLAFFHSYASACRSAREYSAAASVSRALAAHASGVVGGGWRQGRPALLLPWTLYKS